jgi:hypothetical protein
MTDLFLQSESQRLADVYAARVREGKLRAASPLRGRVAQEACDVGLFSDDAAQLDCVDRMTVKR